MQRDIPVQRDETKVTAALRVVTRLSGGVVTFTTNGGHSAGSFHYVGQAVDIALPSGPTVNSPALGAVAAELLRLVPLRFIREFIWSGPNPVYIKNGKRVAPYAVAAHRNHIHLAATADFTYQAPEVPMPDYPNHPTASAPIGIAMTGDGLGYVILMADGSVYAFGTAQYLGRVHKV